MLGMRFDECKEIKKDIERVNDAQERKEEDNNIIGIDLDAIMNMSREQLIAEYEMNKQNM